MVRHECSGCCDRENTYLRTIGLVHPEIVMLKVLVWPAVLGPILAAQISAEARIGPILSQPTTNTKSIDSTLFALAHAFFFSNNFSSSFIADMRSCALCFGPAREAKDDVNVAGGGDARACRVRNAVEVCASSSPSPGGAWGRGWRQEREREREQARPIKWQIQAIVGGERRRERKSERREAARGKIR